MNNKSTKPREKSLFPRSLTYRAVLPSVAIAILALLLVPFANQTAKPLYSFLDHPVLKWTFLFTKQFVSVYCVGAFCIAAWIWRPSQRAAIIVLLIALACAGVVNETLKITTRRVRPPYTVLSEIDGDGPKWVKRYIESHPGTNLRREPVDQWLFINPRDAIYDDHLESFPSGHASGAFVLAAFLLALWPRARYLWFACALACAIARIGLHRHFLEDVLFGGACGWIVAQLVFSWKWPARLGEYLVGIIIHTWTRCVGQRTKYKGKSTKEIKDKGIL